MKGLLSMGEALASTHSLLKGGVARKKGWAEEALQWAKLIHLAPCLHALLEFPEKAI